MVMLGGFLGPALIPLAAVRFGTSAVQSWLNIRLGKRRPVAQQTRLDYALLGLIFAGAYLAAGIGQATGDLASPHLYLPMLVPFSILQWRMTQRSFDAHRAEAAGLDAGAGIPAEPVPASRQPEAA